MDRSRTLALAVSGAVALAAPTATIALQATPAHAAGCTTSDGQQVRSAALRSPYSSGSSGTVYLYYSASSHCAWGVVVSTAPPCVPGNDFCGGAQVNRSDGAYASCSIPAGGNKCVTAPIYDHPYTSYATGWVDNGPFTFMGATGSY